MVEINFNCEESTCFFVALSPKNKVFNQIARVAALNGQEFSGIHDSMCWPCVEKQKRDFVLEEKRLELLHR